MRPHFLGAARSRPAVPVHRQLISVLLAAAVALLGLVALSAAASPAAQAADPAPVRNLAPPSIYDDPDAPDDGPTVGQLALAHPGVWSPTPDSVTLTWYRSGSSEPIGTGAVIVVPVEALGQTLTVKATAAKAGYAPTTVASEPSAAVLPGTPANYAKPAIFGTPETGSTVVVWEGAWSVEATSYTYRWFQEGTAAPIGTGKELVVPAAADGKKLTVEVTLKADHWKDGVATSDPVTAHAPGTGPVRNVAKPAISEHPTVGALAVAHPGAWDPQADSVDVEWFRSGSANPIGTGLTIVVPAAALGETLTVRATAHKEGRADAVVTSAPSDVVGDGTLQNVEEPAIFGSPVVGNKVEAWPGSWFPAPDTTTYRWFVEGTASPVGIGKTLTVPAAAAGKKLTVEVTATKAAYDDAVATSAPVTVTAQGANPVQNTVAPSIEGTLKVGETVTADTGTWNPSDAARTVAWYRSGSPDPIHTGPSLVVPADAEGEMLAIAVKATKAGNADGYAVSAPQGPVLAAGASPALENLVPPAITPNPKVGQLVGAHPGVWSAEPDSVTLTWSITGEATSFATGNYVVVPPAAAGKTLTVEAVATKAGHTSGQATSEPSDVVAKGTLQPAVAPKVYGTPMPGATVVAYDGVWPAGPDSFSYRWLVDGSPLAGATTKELVVPAGTTGKQLSVEVTAKKAGYADAALESAKVVVEAAGTTAVQNVAPPKVLVNPASGLPKVGDLVGANVGVWNPWPADSSGFVVQWFRSGSAQPIGTGVFLVVPPEAAGQQLSVKVTAKRTGYLDGSALSAPVTVLTSAQSPACGVASTALTSATVAQAGATAALVAAEAKVSRLKAKKKAAKQLDMRTKVAQLKVKLRKARSAVATARAELGTADANLAAAQAKHTANCT
ncbi:hypothetical protein ACFFOS_23955 [Nocardioides kongjuensis]|uniref:Ig-like domain-containing protein n=1 Tax=Nocardioides kongjuensis TaxID=349522 RepID=A0A852RBK0_9ACTN|nr:hypothetical protein [Nocardioides kongjuensis]NYD30971.1 hypothetical protein [Nocardioides kongjuensis]